MRYLLLFLAVFALGLGSAAADVQTLTNPIWQDISSYAVVDPEGVEPLASAQIFGTSEYTDTAEAYCDALGGVYLGATYTSGLVDIAVVSGVNPTVWTASSLDGDGYALSIDCDIGTAPEPEPEPQTTFLTGDQIVNIQGLQLAAAALFLYLTWVWFKLKGG